MNRRRFSRRKHRIRVRLEEAHIASMTGDVGVEGLFVYSARILKPGTKVRLTLELPSGPARAEGIVRWAKRVPMQMMGVTKGGMGIQLLSAPPEFIQYLQDHPDFFRNAVGQ